VLSDGTRQNRTRSISCTAEEAAVLDVVIRGGTVVDGTGAPGRRADVGIRNGRIVAVGDVSEDAVETVEAGGLVVAPGFVDPHTHYDAQLFWDPAASPSNLHGVTSMIAGNCGFTLAPLAPEDADYLRRMMAKVEGMPLPALETGVPWSWRSFGEYLAALDGRVALNVGFLVGHCAIRRNVMGTGAVGNEATPEQLDAMVRMLHEAIEAGGLGFSTTLSFTHSDGDGQPVASRWASREEVLALCAAVKDHEGTTLEYVTDGCLRGFSDEEVEMMAEMTLAGRRPLNWNVLTIDAREPDRYRDQLAACEYAFERGGRAVALTMPVLVEMNMSFRNYCALFMLPGWSEVMNLPVPERIAKLRDPEVRRWMNERAHSPEAGVFARLASWGRYQIGDTYSAANEGLKGRVVADLAERANRGTFDTLLDIVIADELQTVLWPLPSDNDLKSWQLRAEAWEHPHVMIGGSDAGAHLDRMCGAPYTTAFLADTLRGRQLTSLERCVQLMTQAPARLFGLRERGEVREGFHADLVLFDPETVDSGEVRLVDDLPGGTRRLFADAVGVQRVYVNGQAVVVEGKETEARPGTVLRSGRDTSTVPIPADQ
jgi:N-acyl-D-aspartate/D-glutamate deacylase